MSPPAPSPVAPTASLFYQPSSNIAAGKTLTFDGALSGASNAPVTRYTWDFGDGSAFAYGEIVTHAYAAQGMYTVTLTVTDAHGLTTSTQETVDVSVAPNNFASINFAISPNPNLITAGWENQWIVGKTLTFDASAFNASSGFLPSYSWNFGDGATGTGVIVSHAYAQAATYSVTLTVTNLEGDVQLITRQVQILPMPAAEIYVETLPTQFQVGDNISLNIMISNVSGLWAWQAGMTFNSSVLECITTSNPSNVAPKATSPTTPFSEGDFLKRGGNTVWIPNSVTDGTIGACGCSLLSPATAQSGNGILATVTFKVIGEGNLDIHLADVILVNPYNNEIPVNVAT